MLLERGKSFGISSNCQYWQALCDTSVWYVCQDYLTYFEGWIDRILSFALTFSARSKVIAYRTDHTVLFLNGEIPRKITREIKRGAPNESLFSLPEQQKT